VEFLRKMQGFPADHGALSFLHSSVQAHKNKQKSRTGDQRRRTNSVKQSIVNGQGQALLISHERPAQGYLQKVQITDHHATNVNDFNNHLNRTPEDEEDGFGDEEGEGEGRR